VGGLVEGGGENWVKVILKASLEIAQTRDSCKLWRRELNHMGGVKERFADLRYRRRKKLERKGLLFSCSSQMKPDIVERGVWRRRWRRKWWKKVWVHELKRCGLTFRISCWRNGLSKQKGKKRTYVHVHEGKGNI